jgi:hypothetical protein
MFSLHLSIFLPARSLGRYGVFEVVEDRPLRLRRQRVGDPRTPAFLRATAWRSGMLGVATIWGGTLDFLESAVVVTGVDRRRSATRPSPGRC